MEIKFKSIGVLHTKGSDIEVREKGDLEGELEIYPEFKEGFKQSTAILTFLFWSISTGCGRNRSGLYR